MSSKIITIKILFVFAILIASPSAWAATYYVSASDGNDSYPGTLSSPWKTISKASSTLQPGDTVYIRQGTYRETLRPQKSGTSGNYITYAGYNNEDATITGVYDGVDLTNRSYIVLDGLRIVDVGHYWVNMHGASTNNIIKNSYMRKADGWGGIYLRDGSNYNKILNNTLISAAENGVGGPDDTIFCWSSHHNIFEGNDIQFGAHVALNIEGRGVKGYHVIRNNRIYNPWHSGLAVWRSADYSIIEGNTIIDSGESYQNNVLGSDRDRSMSREQHAGFQVSSSNLIIRNNTLVNNGRQILDTWTDFADGQDKIADNNRIYNNTFYNNYISIESRAEGGTYGNIYKNNIIDNSRQYSVKQNTPFGYNGIFYIMNNISEGQIRFSGLSDTNHWSENTNAATDFVSPASGDFNLKNGSPMIDAGHFLTSTINSGSGNTIQVGDAKYFTDGMGIIEGDLIQLEGQTQSLRIVEIANNFITVDKNTTWNKGDGVSLSFSGRTPDLGAFEYNSSSAPSAPTGLKMIIN